MSEQFNFDKAPDIESSENPKKTKIFFIRHSQATYVNTGKKLRSESPTTDIVEEQVPDIAPDWAKEEGFKGEELARSSAREFFSKLNPETDTIYIASSNQMRTLETASFYAEEASAAGFEVVNHGESTGTDIAGQVGKGLVKSFNLLSLPQKEGETNPVEYSVFNPKTKGQINWDAINDPDFKQKWEQAIAIVEADNQGSFGNNFQKHAEAVREIFPDISTPDSLHKWQYKKLMRLAGRFQEMDPGEKNMVIIAFGHENYMGKALEEDTGSHSIGNCEAIEVTEDGTLRRMSVE